MFGTTGECKEVGSEEIEALESHSFPDIQTIFWRNPKLNFRNKVSLLESLEERPHKDWLRRVNECQDEKVLKYFLKEATNIEIQDNSEFLQILWECCQIPDFVKKTYGHHFEVVNKIFKFLTSGDNKVPNHYMKEQLSLLDKLDGNVDSLSLSLIHI